MLIFLAPDWIELVGILIYFGSFKIVEGMEVEQYMKFRNTLAPASGFQSAQYRMVEFGSTELINLIDVRFRFNKSKYSF